MFKNIFLVFVLGHVLGDYYFQSDRMADIKNKKYTFLLLHSAVYAVIMTICVLFFLSMNILFYALISSIFHFIIDTAKYILINKKMLSLKEDANLYIIDQLLHIVSIITVCYIIVFSENDIIIPFFTTRIFEIISQDAVLVLKWIVAFLLVAKPANISIKKLIFSYKPEDQCIDRDNCAGAFIGTLERIIILIFLYYNQYSAIGFVFTAKSIARYNKIAESQEFSEYYLLGTLSSVLFAICTYFIVYL